LRGPIVQPSHSRALCGLCGLLLTLGLLCAIVGCDSSDDAASDAASATPSPVPAHTIAARPPTEMELPIRIAVTLPLFEEFARGREGER
jgi:hypothetical protein